MPLILLVIFMVVSVMSGVGFYLYFQPLLRNKMLEDPNNSMLSTFEVAKSAHRKTLVSAFTVAVLVGFMLYQAYDWALTHGYTI